MPGAGAGGPAGGGGLPGGPGWPLVPEGVFRSRYAGAMLLHAFFARSGAGAVLAGAAAGPGRAAGPADVALLAAVSMCFALGAATTEQFKHLAAAEAGPLAGLGVLPGLRTLRPRLAQIADGSDPLAVQAMFASAMLAADPVTSGVYYVDDHFVPYSGARPVARGWNNKRGKAERGRADTHVTAHDGRAVCFVTGQPSGLSITLPPALAELKKAAPPGAAIMLGFDRGAAQAGPGRFPLAGGVLRARRHHLLLRRHPGVPDHPAAHPVPAGPDRGAHPGEAARGEAAPIRIGVSLSHPSCTT